MILREFEEKSKGIGADLADTAGGRDALAARTSHAQHTFTQTHREGADLAGTAGG